MMNFDPNIRIKKKMAASVKFTRSLVNRIQLKQQIRFFQTSVVACKSTAGKVKVSKGEKPITYEQANPPYYTGVRKGWNTHHTGNIDLDQDGSANRIFEDVFLRKFIYGTFHGCLATDMIIKRRANMIILTAVMLRVMAPQKFYFLVGYTEELLSFWFKCPVKMEIQIVNDKPIYKWI
ncbi:28S ribosomal protein S24-A, mitochondrial-like [Anneissia japonica]|uniref:28S ribosomal protein S24-A, mitochondrial-like n=1 Tax=Anneissia japonica TaxID=1529436 RepID=UPI0014257BF0|nr:28S ribosomal protein S24-A, mitochondrial-like [Anneissia japonica]